MSRLSRFLPKFLRGDKNNIKTGDKSDCKVIFLDETEYFLPYKGGFKGQYILDKVYEQLNLFEKDYFGLRFIDQSGQTHWLDVHKTLSSQFKGCVLPYTLYFGVKFYPADPCKLKEEITRYQFFLQVKRDILHGRLPVMFDEAAELFSYAVQSELGDFESQQLPAGYVSEFQFVPNQTEQLEDQIAVMHRRLGGTVPATAELKFLDKVKWLDMYGVDLHPVMGDGNTEYFLGLTPTGIVVYKNKTKVGNYFWPRVTKVNYKAKVFIVKVRDKINDEHTYAFELQTKAGCKHLWKCCVEHHAFFRLCQLGDAASRTSKPFRSTAKHRNSGRFDRQKEPANQGREQPHVVRVQSRRQARRAMSDTRLNQADMMTTGIQYSEGHVTMVVTPEHVKGPRHRSLPDLKGRESPTSTKSAPWETNHDGGLYTSGRESPVSVTQSENVNQHRRHRESDSDVGYRRRRGYDSDGGHVTKHHHHYHHGGTYSHYGTMYQQRSSRRSGYDSEPQSSSHRRKYFPSSRKGSDNESDVSFTRRRRKEGDSGSESDISPKYTARQRKAKSMGPDNFEKEWNMAVDGMYLPENRNGGPTALHSAPGGEARQKKMRRKRSKSPGSKHPPEELRQYIEFDLVDPVDEDQLKDIPYVNVETKAEPFKIKYSPKSRHRYRSPKRKAFNELELLNKGGGGYISDDGPPPYKTPERTPEPTHRQMNKTGGYYSDTGSHRASSLPRTQNGPVQSSQPNNSLNRQSKSFTTDIKAIANFHQNSLFYDPHTSPRYQRQTMVHGYHGYRPPPTAVFKPIDSVEDRIPPIENVNSIRPRQNAGAPNFNLDLDIRGHGGDGEGHDLEEERNRDSGLNSSQGSSSTPQNMTPRTANRMYGTQDAIARLYSSPAGTRRTGNQSASPANRNSGYNQYGSTNTTGNQSTSAVNRNSGYNQYGSTNQNGPHNQYPASSTINSVPISRPSNIPGFHNSPYSQQSENNLGRSPQNGGYMDRTQPINNSSFPRQTNYDRRGQSISKQNGFANHSSDMFYTQSNSTPHYVTPSGQDFRNQNSQMNHSRGNMYTNNTQDGSRNNYQSSNFTQQYTQNHSKFGDRLDSQNRLNLQNRNTFQSPETSSSQQFTQNHSSYGDRADGSNNWKYVGNGDIGRTNQGYAPSGYTQQGHSGSRSPYKLSPASSPVKQGTNPHQIAGTSSPHTQSRREPANRNSGILSPATQNVNSPDSAISSLPSSSNIDGFRSNSRDGINHYTSRSPSSSPQKYNTETNFARVRTPAFGQSDIWTEI